MNPDSHKHKVEEISAEEIEIVSPEKEHITKISADDPTPNFEIENPVAKLFEQMQEWKKVRLFGFIAFVFALAALMWKPFYLAPAAIIFVLFDFLKGSKFTRKIDIAALLIAALALLNAWK